jgi:hypothetical protein
MITRPEDSYRLWCVVVRELETTKILVNEEEAMTHWAVMAPREKILTTVRGKKMCYRDSQASEL